MSEKRLLLGWEPREFHQHYDAAGEPCAASEAHTTVVTRETEWDDEQVGRMLALAYIDAGKCSCGCGLPADISQDKTRNFATQPTTCHARKWLTVAQRDAHQLSLPIKDRDPKWKQGTPQAGDGELWSVFEHQPSP